MHCSSDSWWHSSWTVSRTVRGTLTHACSATLMHCSSDSWWHSLRMSVACLQSFLYWSRHCRLDTVSCLGCCVMRHLRSWTSEQAVSETSWHCFLATVSYLVRGTCSHTSLGTRLHTGSGGARGAP